jgi:hypothetical protein
VNGIVLDGSKHSYQMTFPAGALPPVNAFWSITMYDGRTQLLIDNPINRYLINSPMLPQLKKNADGSLTVYLQKDSPGKERESNWLPAPDGPMFVVMRLYWPKTEPPSVYPLGKGTWQPPALVPVENLDAQDVKRLASHGIRLILLLGPFLFQTGQAQDLEPRSYTNTPVGMNFLLLGYFYSDGDVATDPSLPLKDGHVTVNGALTGYVRSLGMWGKSGKISAVLPYACAYGTAKLAGQPGQRDICGLADPRLRLSVNLYGAPALTADEFRGYHQDLIIGTTLQVTAPYGQYDSDKLLNIGTNRWSVKTELGASQALGRVTLELAGAATFYTDNDNYFGGQKREQDPVYSIQGHIIYSFSHGIWGAIDATYFTGGRTTTDGVKDDDTQKNTRIGATLALPVTRLIRSNSLPPPAL